MCVRECVLCACGFVKRKLIIWETDKSFVTTGKVNNGNFLCVDKE